MNDYIDIQTLSDTPLQNMKDAFWFGSPHPVDIYLYVLELNDGCYYVGLTSDVAKRLQQHRDGGVHGAEWTRLHKPRRVIHAINTGTKNSREAEDLENEVTILMMIRYGIDHVRGGHFSYPDRQWVEHHLRLKGAWDRVVPNELNKQPYDTSESWDQAMRSLLKHAIKFYDAGSPKEQQQKFFAEIYRLTRYRYWRNEFSPALSPAFWGRKGILPVLLSFKLGRPIASRLDGPFNILAAALCRGKNGHHPLRRLFLMAWKTYQPACTANQAITLTRFMSYLDDGTHFDRQYDEFVSVLLPETRHHMRFGDL